MKSFVSGIMCKLYLHSWCPEVSYQGDGIVSIASKCSKCGKGKMESMPFREGNQTKILRKLQEISNILSKSEE